MFEGVGYSSLPDTYTEYTHIIYTVIAS